MGSQCMAVQVWLSSSLILAVVVCGGLALAMADLRKASSRNIHRLTTPQAKAGESGSILKRRRTFYDNDKESAATASGFDDTSVCRISHDGTAADCSQNCGRLSYVPRLPDSVRFLNFSYNCLVNISNDNFFNNVTFINSLDLGNNDLTHISPGVFESTKNLEKLSLVYNTLSYRALHPVLSIRTLRQLDLRFMPLGTPPSDIFSHNPLPELEVLFMHRNGMENLNLSTFLPLRNLKELGLASNEFAHVQAPSRPMMALTKLNLKTNAIFHFPETCQKQDFLFPGLTRQSRGSLFPSLTHLFLRGNQIRKLPRDVCLPHLKLLDVSENKFKVFPRNSFSVDRFPALSELYIESMNPHLKRIEKFAFHNPSLMKISLMFDSLAFDSPDISNDSFAGCDNLVSLQLSHNYISNITEKTFVKLLGGLYRLRYLYMGNALIQQLTPGMFRTLHSLSTLSLYQNRLADLPDGFVDGLLNLRTLDLNRNQISVIRESTFSAPTRGRLVRLDLSGNPFVCSCNLRWFRDWLATNVSTFGKSWTGYHCHNRDNVKVAAFIMDQQACLLSQETSILIIVIITFLMVCLTFTSILYRYRWHIRLLLYEAFRSGRENRWRCLQEEYFQFDVFVSSASEDRQWVHEHLMPELEQRLGLRLCIHERDFIPGKNIVANIEDSVEVSKKVLMVFSTNFARSQWCQFELTLCHHHVTENDDALLVVFLHDVPSRDMTSEMMAVMRTTTYIEWADEPEAGLAFWGRIRLALHEIISGRRA